MSALPGPFKVTIGENLSEVVVALAVNDSALSEQPEISNQDECGNLECAGVALAVERRFDCDNYETCLGLAAALNWQSFTCRECTGEINQQILWRAHQITKKDNDLADLCKLPGLKSLGN